MWNGFDLFKLFSDFYLAWPGLAWPGMKLFVILSGETFSDVNFLVTKTPKQLRFYENFVFLFFSQNN